jgi:hypothetical protein
MPGKQFPRVADLLTQCFPSVLLNIDFLSIVKDQVHVLVKALHMHKTRVRKPHFGNTLTVVIAHSCGVQRSKSHTKG